jgi:hypothetical protein
MYQKLLKDTEYIPRMYQKLLKDTESIVQYNVKNDEIGDYIIFFIKW